MALSEKQVKALRAKLSHRFVKTRQAQGNTLSFVEGWHVIAEANRIFGFENWDRQTQAPECLWSEAQRGQTVCFYSAKVRVTVRAGETVTVREGIGTGVGRSPQAEVAHELAVKAAETDATKRALATFGNPFGLALYDRDQQQVTRPREAARSVSPSQPLTLTLTRPDGRTVELTSLEAFAASTTKELNAIDGLEAAYAFWTQNLQTFTDISRRGEVGAQTIEKLVAALKDRLRQLAIPPQKPDVAEADGSPRSAFLIPKETRIRDRDHLAFVASQPCLVCGRRPAQAHHLKFAQSRSMSLKVSDEYTVPLCNVHHDQLHRSGDERAWWARNGIIEPLKFADRLWAASRTGKRDPYADDPSREEGSPTPSPSPSPTQKPSSAEGSKPCAGGGSKRPPKDLAKQNEV
jgi:DNA recombination protein Rad52